MCLDFCLGHQWLKLVFTLLIPIKRSFYDYIACKGEMKLKFLLRHRKKQLQQFFLNVFIYLFFLHFLDCFFLLFVSFISLFFVEWRLGVVLLNALLPNCSFNVCIFSINEKTLNINVVINSICSGRWIHISH